MPSLLARLAIAVLVLPISMRSICLQQKFHFKMISGPMIRLGRNIEIQGT